jgi:hypothetical protein
MLHLSFQKKYSRWYSNFTKSGHPGKIRESLDKITKAGVMFNRVISDVQGPKPPVWSSSEEDSLSTLLIWSSKGPSPDEYTHPQQFTQMLTILIISLGQTHKFQYAFFWWRMRSDILKSRMSIILDIYVLQLPLSYLKVEYISRASFLYLHIHHVSHIGNGFMGQI